MLTQALIFKCLQYKSFKNTVGKGRIAPNEHFSFSPCVFYPFGELSAILIKSKFVVCKTLSVSEESKFCHLGKGKSCISCISPVLVDWCYAVPYPITYGPFGFKWKLWGRVRSFCKNVYARMSHMYIIIFSLKITQKLFQNEGSQTFKKLCQTITNQFYIRYKVLTYIINHTWCPITCQYFSNIFNLWWKGRQFTL